MLEGATEERYKIIMNSRAIFQNARITSASETTWHLV